MTKLGQHLEKIDAPFKMWEIASKNFANTASGNVDAFICNSYYRGVNSIFWKIEMPTLAANSRVCEVRIHIFE